MVTILSTILSGLAIGAALVFGLFLVAGGVLPSVPLTVFALLFGLFLAWESEPTPPFTKGRRNGRSKVSSRNHEAHRAAIS